MQNPKREDFSIFSPYNIRQFQLTQKHDSHICDEKKIAFIMML